MNTEALDTPDPLDEILSDYAEAWTEQHGDVLKASDEAKAKILQYVDSECKKARINMVDYFDQCPANDLMDWKGLFADTRKLLEAELNTGGNSDE